MSPTKSDLALYPRIDAGQEVATNWDPPHPAVTAAASVLFRGPDRRLSLVDHLPHDVLGDLPNDSAASEYLRALSTGNMFVGPPFNDSDLGVQGS